MNITLEMIQKRVPGAKLTGHPDILIKDLVQDSREVTPGPCSWPWRGSMWTAINLFPSR